MTTLKHINKILFLFVCTGSFLAAGDKQCSVQLPVVQSASVAPEKHSFIYTNYLSKGVFDEQLFLAVLFPKYSAVLDGRAVTVDQLDLALDEIRVYLNEIVAQRFKEGSVDMPFVDRMIKHCWLFLGAVEESYVDIQTNKVYRVRYKERKKISIKRPRQKLSEFWKRQLMLGKTVRIYAFLAQSIDYEIALLGTILSFPCATKKALWRVEGLLSEIEWEVSFLEANTTFVGYYKENVELMRSVFAIWKADFEKRMAEKKASKNGRG